MVLGPLGKLSLDPKVIDMQTSSPGKHGHAKVRITALDVFTGKKVEELSPATHNVMVPEVVRKDYIVSSRLYKKCN